MFSRWIVTNITSASVTTFLAFLAGIISWSVYCRLKRLLKIPQALSNLNHVRLDLSTLQRTRIAMLLCDVALHIGHAVLTTRDK
jgi:hypothetical protein